MSAFIILIIIIATVIIIVVIGTVVIFMYIQDYKRYLVVTVAKMNERPNSIDAFIKSTDDSHTMATKKKCEIKDDNI